MEEQKSNKPASSVSSSHARLSEEASAKLEEKKNSKQDESADINQASNDLSGSGGINI